jgi:hypothetical protein
VSRAGRAFRDAWGQTWSQAGREVGDRFRAKKAA